MNGQYNTAVIWDTDHTGATVLFFCNGIGEYKIAGQYHVQSTELEKIMDQAAWMALEDGIIEHSNLVYDGDQWVVISQDAFNRVYRARRHRTLWADDDKYESQIRWNGKYINWIN